MRIRTSLLASVMVVALSAWGCGGSTGPVPVEHSGEISGDQTWSGTHIMTDNVTVTGAVTVESCTTMRFQSGTTMSIQEGGSIRLEGRSECPVQVTSAKGSPAAGDWERIDIYSSANNNNLIEHAVVEYGGGGSGYGNIWVESGAQVEMRDVTVRHSGSHGVYFEQGASVDAFENVQISEVGLEAVRIMANDVSVIDSLSSSTGARARVPGGTVDSAQTWKNLEVPYLIDEGMSVQARWEVQPGATIQAGSEVTISVENGGAVRMMGESGNRVTFRSSLSSPEAGDWARFDIYATASGDSLLKYTDINHAGSDPTYGALWVESGQTVTLENVNFSMINACDVSGGGTVDAVMTDYDTCS